MNWNYFTLRKRVKLWHVVLISKTPLQNVLIFWGFVKPCLLRRHRSLEPIAMRFPTSNSHVWYVNKPPAWSVSILIPWGGRKLEFGIESKPLEYGMRKRKKEGPHRGPVVAQFRTVSRLPWDPDGLLILLAGPFAGQRSYWPIVISGLCIHRSHPAALWKHIHRLRL